MDALAQDLRHTLRTLRRDLGFTTAIVLPLAIGVAQRTREIGVRIALDAFSKQLVAIVLRQGQSVALPGLAVGIVTALRLSEAPSALLFDVATNDLTSILFTSGLLMLTTLTPCCIPARRAARVDPMTALRSK